MHEIIMMNVKTLDGEKPFCITNFKGWSGDIHKALFDKSNRFMGIVNFNGNGKQRRQQRRALLRELNQ